MGDAQNQRRKEVFDRKSESAAEMGALFLVGRKTKHRDQGAAGRRKYKIVRDPQAGAMGSATLTLHSVAAEVNGSTIATPGQNARLSFAGAAAQQVNLSVTDAILAKVSVLNPD